MTLLLPYYVLAAPKHAESTVGLFASIKDARRFARHISLDYPDQPVAFTVWKLADLGDSIRNENMVDCGHLQDGRPATSL